ncbi:hypothetical protein MKZ38_001605 [Zalerion maritima]|uniref:Uncharacterized protein n=1 Tax=Zalerion maritima TaxID=339359 RepID=A0AAD5WTR1_9PEZI|nr:hypothetical protein MKZ38_001605 [Zalerion maritima]
MGFRFPLSWGDMELSNTLCNELPRMHNDMRPGREHIKNLAAIIGQHKMTGKFAAELLHKHEDTPAGQVKLEVDINTMPAELIKRVLAEIVDPSKLEAALQTVSGKWMKPVQLDSLDLNNIHGIVFKLDPKEKCLVPYEFAEGPMSVSESGTVEKNNLTNMIGLQFLGAIENDGQHTPFTAEFELGEKGTITLPTSILKDVELVPTSWPDATWSGTGKPTDTEPPAGQSWAKKVVKGVETHT